MPKMTQFDKMKKCFCINKLIAIPISWKHGIAYHGLQCDNENLGKRDKWRTKDGMMGLNNYPQYLKVMSLRN